MIKLKIKEEYHHYIVGSSVELKDTATYIEDSKHFFLSIASSLRSNQFVLISEIDDVDVNFKEVRSNPITYCDKYISLNISLKNKIKDLPDYSGLVNLINLNSYFKSHF